MIDSSAVKINPLAREIDKVGITLRDAFNSHNHHIRMWAILTYCDLKNKGTRIDVGRNYKNVSIINREPFLKSEVQVEELSIQNKIQIINQNLVNIKASIYDATINAQFAKSIEDTKEVERLRGVSESLVKRRDFFATKLVELEKESVAGASL